MSIAPGNNIPAAPGPGPFAVSARNASTQAMAVQAGDTWSFSATGRWTDWFIACGPEGYRNFLADIFQASPRVPGPNFFCLCGQVTQNGQPTGETFAIGRGCTHRFTSSGMLSLFTNDMETMYWNNRGAVTVNVMRGGVAASNPDADPTNFEGVTGRWQLFRRTVEKTRGTGTLAILVIGACLILGLLQQGIDLIRAVSDDSLGAPKQQVVAFALGLLFLAIQSWLWPRALINFNYGIDRSAWRPKWLLDWGPRLLGMAPFVLVLFAMRDTLLTQFGLPVILVVLGLLFLLFLYKREDVISKMGGTVGRSPLAPWWIGICLALVPVALVVTSVAPVGFGHLLGAPAVVFVALGLIIPPMIIAIQSGMGAGLPIVSGMLVLAAVFSWFVDNHEIGHRAFGRGPAPMTDITRLNLAQAYQAWRAQQPNPAKGEFSMVLVASEGGASRAGDWTAEVLSELHKRSEGRLAKRLFAISSVSGGSVGAVGYAALLHAAPTLGPEKFPDTLPNFTGQDALSPALTGFLFPDLLQRFLPFAFLPDRAEALERSWEVGWKHNCPQGADDSCADLMQTAFLTLRPQESKTWQPILIVNGASEETGRRILTSTVDFGDAIDADDFHKIVNHDVQLSTAISNGARFPWISPAGTLEDKTGRKGHLLDGGYFDAAGIATMGELAQAVTAVAGGDRIHFVFVFIGYKEATAAARPANQKPVPTSIPALGAPARRPEGSTEEVSKKPDGGIQLLNEVLAPLVGLFASRTAHENHITYVFRHPPTPTTNTADFVPVMLCNGQDGFEPPMDWALSGAARTFIHDALSAHANISCSGENAMALQQINDLIGKE